ncbi:hypothetical protein [Terrisporobacter hibernicus]|uniref:Uncharacterized protein n=1 Tax=Terrisporobacter hibernicus TaxID=2813371 RepID=A0AAX2ZGN1_9FIRM|nr:hypothetical protein [Terrisporobacter hibernicus]UEL47224.1 hypothetical protein JW646_16565 [Terrisporobacter hibernicus]
MAIIYEDKKILLTDNSAKNFVRKLKREDLEVSKKRDTFIKQFKESLQVTRSNGVTKITLKLNLNNM